MVETQPIQRTRFVGFEELCNIVDCPNTVIDEIQKINVTLLELEAACMSDAIPIKPADVLPVMSDILTSYCRICNLLQINGAGIAHNAFQSLVERNGKRLGKSRPTPDISASS